MQNNDNLLPAVKQPKAEDRLTLREATTAASNAGLSASRLKKMTGRTRIGKFIEQIGPGRRARGDLEVAGDTIEALLEDCDRLQKRAEADGDLKIAAMMLHRRVQLVEAMIKAAGTQMKAPANTEKVMSMVPSRLFPANIAIGVSVQGNEPEKKVLELPAADAESTAI